jgi:CRP/FNR family putative post-exponential-phase nitrogen-starvation transcriptional regulator
VEKKCHTQEINKYILLYELSEILDKALIKELKLYRFKPGEYIVRAGEYPTHFYFYVQGKSKVFQLLENGKALLCRFYHPFEIVGDVEIFSGKQNVCNLQALTDVTCLGIPMNRIKKAAESNPKLLKMLCCSLGEKLASFNMISAVNQNYPLENRLASYLSAVSESGKNNEIVIREFYTNNLTELAELLGTSYRHLTRTIRKFRNEKIITKQGAKIGILDQRLLTSMAKDIYM